MKKWLAALGFLLLLAVGIAAAGWSWWQRELHRPFKGYAGEVEIDIPSGTATAAILDRLATQGILDNAELTRLYLRLEGSPSLQAGRYRFDEALTVAQVIDRLHRGDVVLRPAILIEGLTLEEAATGLAEQGFGDRDQFLRLFRDPSLIHDLDPEAESLEGYIYPDTYHFPHGTTEASVVESLVGTFLRRYHEQVEPLLPPGSGRTVREIVTLASVVEKEAQLDSERATIAGVYSNRLRRGIALYADPTVIYALKLAGRWDGNIRKSDLAMDSPYNTYLYPGLPPGPICSAGVRSLVAAAQPADVPYLYFVSRNDGSHVFAATLSEHNRNVDKWQKQYWRERWAKERALSDGAAN
ncbi:MAG: endolytic transglycosylase MltG [Thermoanaerobaculia bacterium]|nr:endolytic transglycosylase MltG [Thermoanaerobaculia bacterium]